MGLYITLKKLRFIRLSNPDKLDFTMTTQHPWTDDELDVFHYIHTLVENRLVKTTAEVEGFIRQKFDWVSMTNSYHLAMTYGRYRQKIDAVLAERQKVEDPKNVKADCCRTCEAAS